MATTSKKAARIGPARVLLSHRYLWPENLSLYPAMLKDIAQWHAARGEQLTILTAKARSANDQLRRDKWAKLHRIEMREIPLPIDRGCSFVRRVVNAIRYTVHLFITLVRGHFELVSVASYPPVLPATVARLLARRKGFTFIYHVQDILPESLRRSRSGFKRLCGRALQIIDAANMRAAAAVITLSDDMKQTLVRRGLSAHKIVVIPNHTVDACETHHPRPAGKTVRLVYAGNHGGAQNLRCLLLAVARAACQCNVRLEMIGDGAELARLKQIASDADMRHVEFTGTLPRDEAQRRIATADVGIVPALPGLYDVAFPSKIVSYLVAGLPVLVFADADSSIARFLKKHNFGTTASPTNVNDAADAIAALVARIDTYDRARIARTAAQAFSKETYFSAYGQVVARCLPKEPRFHDLHKRSA